MENKKWYLSKGAAGAIAAIILGVIGVLGFDTQGETESLTGLIMQIGVVVTSAIALYGRLTAKTKLTK